MCANRKPFNCAFWARAVSLKRASRWNAADFVRGSRTGLLDKGFRVSDQVADQMIDYVAQGFVEFKAHAGAGMCGFDSCVEVGEERDFVAQRVQVEQIGFERVVKVGGVVRDFIHPVDKLGFEWRPQVE